MQITIQGKHTELPQDLQEYAERQVNKLTRISNGVISTTVTFSDKASKDNNRSRRVEIVMFAPGRSFHSEENGKSFEAALDSALDKLKQQLKKLKTKRADKNRQHPGLADIVNAETEHINGNGAVPHSVVMLEKFNIKPMSVQEALMQLKLAKRDFFMFYSDRSMVHCVYKRPDGNIGLLVPENEIIEG